MSASDNVDSGQCTCNMCPQTNISQRTTMRIMFGALQAMKDLRTEASQLDSNAAIDDVSMRCSYPYNWIPPRAREPRREVLIGAHNILLVIYIILQDGGVPDVQAIREICQKEARQLQYTSDYILCGGSVIHILEELTSQVESDIQGEALHVDSEELLETLEQIRPCALDGNLSSWRRALGFHE
ncbi:hypothetical protein H4R24_000262 [Coemansia sp. RSA 988]|nr:hypothetical protein H4R24_000262 [Coemansia sp. RSA 988]